MTKLQRINNVISGLTIILAGFMLMGSSPDLSLQIVAMLLSLSFTVRGFSNLIYYLRLAKLMVGGKSILFKSIIYLDAGLFTSSLSDSPAVYIILYLLLFNIFSGAVSILKGNESRKVGNKKWKGEMLSGAVNIAFAVAAAAAGILMHNNAPVVDLYAAGLVISGIIMVMGAFRRSAIVYIQ